MAQISGIGLENFRVFKEYTEFDFAPITIFTGTNSSGKSSVFKALMLLKDSWKNGKEFEHLDFTGENHHLGDFKNAINNNTKDDGEMIFTLKYTLEEPMLRSGTPPYYLAENSYENFFLKSLSLKITFVDTNRGIKEIQLLTDDMPNEDSSNLNGLILGTILFKYEDGKEYKISIANIASLFHYFNQSTVLEELADLKELGEQNSILKEQNFIRKKVGLPILPIASIPIEPEQHITKSLQMPSTNRSIFIGNIKVFEEYIINDFEKKKNGKEKTQVFNTDFKDKLAPFGAERSQQFILKLEKIIFGRLSYVPFDSLPDFLYETSWGAKFYLQLWKHLPENYIGSGISYSLKKMKEQKLPEYFNEEEAAELEEILQVFSEYTYSDILDDGFLLFIEDFLQPYLDKLPNCISKIENISYIPAIRANTQRIYTYKSQGTEMNEVLLKTKYISRFINKWCQTFGIADSVEVRDIKGVAKEVILKKGEKEIDLVDLGYGVTQLLPIMLKIANSFDKTLYRMSDATLFDDEEGFKQVTVHKINHPNGSILMLEEPETNLHPKLQSMLADFLADVAKTFEVTLLVETHSEYLIRKLQYLTAKKEIKPEDTAIYYLYPPNEVPEGKKQVEKLEMNEDGSLNNDFGEGFFDEATRWKFEILRIKNHN